MSETGIEVRHLKAFRAVMTLGSTMDAARVLDLSQPSVSRLIGELETIRGEILFERRHGRLFPTDRARRLVSEVDRALEGFEAVAGGQDWGKRPLSIAAPNGLATTLLPPVLSELTRLYPHLRVSIDLMSYHATMDAVAMRRADLGLCKEPTRHPAIEKEQLITVGTVALIPASHRLANQEMIRVRDLRGVPLVLLGRHRPFRVELDDAMEKAGILPNVVVETQAVNVARSMVEAGIGVTLANALIASRQMRPSLVARRFELDMPHSFVVVWSRNAPMTPVMAKARELLAKVSREIVGGLLPPSGG